MSPTQPVTLTQVLERAAARYSEQGISIVDSRGRSAERRSYPEILARARDTARRLRAVGVAPGEPILLSLGTSWELVDAWLGAVCAGALPVASAPLGIVGSGTEQLERTAANLERLQVARLLCSESMHQRAQASGLRALEGATLTYAELQRASAASPAEREAEPGDTAFLQLTSGSTGTPNAVVIPHAAAVHNPAAIGEALDPPVPLREWSPNVVSWLPLYHDMGLVGCLLFSIHWGLELQLLSPKTFLARPEVWLQRLAATGPSLSPAPTFAYQSCVERVEPASLEGTLANWRAAMVGAEMVRPETMRAFCERFVERGMSERTIRPCYGLAEGTLAVTADRRGEGVRTVDTPQEARAPGDDEGVSVCVGPAVLDTEVSIVGPNGDPLPAGSVGHVVARGPGIFAGYYANEEATAEALREGWLQTGDLGFLREGELYITGRAKDLLIIRGQNVMPHELEWCADAASAGGGSRRSGAFSVQGRAVGQPDEGELPIVVVEAASTEPDRLGELERAIRVETGRRTGLTLADVVFVRRGRIPKTTSGKIQRNELRRLYLEGKIERLATLRPGPAGTSAARLGRPEMETKESPG